MIFSEGNKEAAELHILRCADCGDTFPAEEEAPTCPSCGSDDLRTADEPLL
jgi:rRNA maturation endonuclease Nob1